MKIKRFIPASSPMDIIFDAKKNGGLDDRDNPVYAGLDDEGFARKRDAYKAECELERRRRDDGQQPPVAYGDLPVRSPYIYDPQTCNSTSFYRILDDDGGVIGYYMIHQTIFPGRVDKSFVFSDEVGDDSDEGRILFSLLNRMDETVMKSDEVRRRFDYDVSKAAPFLVPVEFDWKSSRFASHGQRPKKAGHLVEASEFDKFVIASQRDDGAAMADMYGMGDAFTNKFLTRAKQCPEGIKLE